MIAFLLYFLMNKKVIITGATGLIGTQLCKALLSRGDEVTIFTRNVESAKKLLGNRFNHVKWNYVNPAEWQDTLKNQDALIHLAGANLFNRRWTQSYKKVILESRELSTRNLVTAIGNAKSSIKIFISSSGVGYYGSREDEALTEKSETGNDFLASVCDVWEKETGKANEFGIRTAMLRQGVVLCNDGGALTKFLPLFKFFIGGTLGSGKQWFPWIHIDDLVAIYLYTLDNSEISGPVNAVSTKTIRMKDFTKTLGKALQRPSFFTIPELALKVLLGEAASSVLASQRVIPQKLIDHDFKFKFENLEEAMMDLLKTKGLE